MQLGEVSLDKTSRETDTAGKISGEIELHNEFRARRGGVPVVSIAISSMAASMDAILDLEDHCRGDSKNDIDLKDPETSPSSNGDSLREEILYPL